MHHVPCGKLVSTLFKDLGMGRPLRIFPNPQIRHSVAADASVILGVAECSLEAQTLVSYLLTCPRRKKHPTVDGETECNSKRR